ncbi:hypothetical protein CIRG_09715 [Coccidioides immitis RMSCC 2394]|uniref:Uncharacterized protein n=1 Tax=Coccidioides immitis RMSCC 2394 TaxID=404692 RepID=A0A0J6YQQ2_COCIT|nr:hypothetical protein CIRG_09715 [Coccidioides immitis RMSCC 2394]
MYRWASSRIAGRVGSTPFTGARDWDTPGSGGVWERTSLAGRPLTSESLKPNLHPDAVFALLTAHKEKWTVYLEAMVGVKADVKSLQLTSSGRATQKKREDNQAQKGFQAVSEAVGKAFKGGKQ